MDLDAYKTTYEREKTYWWYIARLDILKAVFRKFVLCQNTKNLRILNVGSGTGNISKSFAEYGRVYSVDYSNEALRFSQINGQRDLVRADAINIPFKNDYFDVVMLYDLLEHVDDDILVLKETKRVLKEGGVAILTVPSYKFMWSRIDDVAWHKRRYLRSGLLNKMDKVHLRKVKVTYFNTFLFPGAIIRRWVEKLFCIKRKGDSFLPSIPHWLNGLMVKIFSFEKYFLKDFSFPFGLSVLAIYKK